MTNPIDIITTALWGVPSDAHQLARAAAGTLTDNRIIANAADALRVNGWRDHDGVTAENLASTVLCSVGDGA